MTDDAYDEGLDASVFETVIITLDESNLSNLRVDSDTYTSVHTLYIQDDDAAPTMSFSLQILLLQLLVDLSQLLLRL